MTADPLDVYYRLTLRIPVDRALRWLNELGDRFGEERLCDALTAEHAQSDELRTLLSRTHARLERDWRARKHQAEVRKAQVEREELATMHTQMSPERMAENLARLRAEMEKAGLL